MSTPVTFTVTRNPRNAGRKPKATESQIVFESIGTQTHTITKDTGTQKEHTPLELLRTLRVVLVAGGCHIDILHCVIIIRGT